MERTKISHLNCVYPHILSPNHDRPQCDHPIQLDQSLYLGGPNNWVEFEGKQTSRIEMGGGLA